MRAVDLGINFFDTANTYHGTISETHLHPEHSGNAESILGDFISGQRNLRGIFIILRVVIYAVAIFCFPVLPVNLVKIHMVGF